MALILGPTRAFCHFLPKNVITRCLSVSKQQEVTPLLADAVLHHLSLQDGQTVIDMTFGDGLHSEAILKSNATVNVVTLDRDPCAVRKAEALALKYPGRVKPLHGRFSDLPSLLSPLGIELKSVDAILIDVGCSSSQLNDSTRGFALEVDGPLDMRMGGPDDPGSITGQDVLMRCGEHDLARILRVYGGEDQSRKIASAIASCRYSMQPLTSTFELRDFLKGVSEVRGNRTAKNVFYALRTFVNNEFNELNYAMLLSKEYLKTGGRLLSLTFHHLEDLVVKRHLSGNMLENNPNPVPLKYYSQLHSLNSEEIEDLQSSEWALLTKHVITASKNYEALDQRVRKAKLRAAVRK